MLRNRQSYAITSSNIMKEKVRVWVNGFTSKRIGNNESISTGSVYQLCASPDSLEALYPGIGPRKLR